MSGAAKYKRIRYLPVKCSCGHDFVFAVSYPKSQKTTNGFVNGKLSWCPQDDAVIKERASNPCPRCAAEQRLAPDPASCESQA